MISDMPFSDLQLEAQPGFWLIIIGRSLVKTIKVSEYRGDCESL
jgi:hypothetical protein